MDSIILIASFKAHLYEILENACKTRQEVIITKRGNQIAKILPISDNPVTPPLFGLLKEKAKINANLLEQISEAWEAEND